MSVRSEDWLIWTYCKRLLDALEREDLVAARANLAHLQRAISLRPDMNYVQVAAERALEAITAPRLSDGNSETAA